MNNLLPVTVDPNRAGLDPSTGDLGIFLNTRGTRISLERQGIELHEGMVLRMYADDADQQGNRDDLVFEGIVTWTDWHGGCWRADVSRSSIRNLSEVRDDPTHWASSVDWTAVYETERVWY